MRPALQRGVIFMPNYRMRNCTFKAIYYHSLYIVIHQCLYHLLFPNYRHQYSRLTPIYIHYFVIKLGVAYASLVSNRSSQNHGQFCQKSFPFFVFVLFFPLFFSSFFIFVSLLPSGSIRCYHRRYSFILIIQDLLL